MTIRLVHNAPLHELLPFRTRTTAVLPSAEVPPTTALTGAIVNVLAQRATTAEVIAYTALRNLIRTVPRLGELGVCVVRLAV